MIKLNRTTEYGLIALKHMSKKTDGNVTSAREVSDIYGLPFEITAKTLQRLKDSGIIQSAQGSKGGYVIQRSLGQVSLADFLVHMEGDQAVVACCVPEPSKTKPCECEYNAKCEIKGMMSQLNNKVWNFLSAIYLSDLTESSENYILNTATLPLTAKVMS